VHIKVTNNFDVTTQVSGNTVTGTASLALKPTVKLFADSLTLEFPALLKFSNLGKQPKLTSEEIDFSVGRKELNLGPFRLINPNLRTGVVFTPGMAPSF
jgi:hypothetical protein